MKIAIRNGTIDEAVRVSQHIPEFENPYHAETYKTQLNARYHIILIAMRKNTPVGFKVGYALEPHVFYSWMGGVIPAYRRNGVAKTLSEQMQAVLLEKGFTTLRIKTRNNHRYMLQMLVSEGFNIVGMEIKEDIAHHSIIFEKPLT